MESFDHYPLIILLLTISRVIELKDATLNVTILLDPEFSTTNISIKVSIYPFFSTNPIRSKQDFPDLDPVRPV